jgi:hypothetical protein
MTKDRSFFSQMLRVLPDPELGVLFFIEFKVTKTCILHVVLVSLDDVIFIMLAFTLGAFLFLFCPCVTNQIGLD